MREDSRRELGSGLPCSAFLLCALPRRCVPAAAGGAAAPHVNAASNARARLDEVRADPLALRAFLKRMPKGADLHSHLSGAVYAETHIRDAIEDELCIDTEAKAFAKSQPVMAGAQTQPVCEQNQIPAIELPKNQRLYNDLVDAFSMRGFVPGGGDHRRMTISSMPSSNSAAPIRATPARWVDEVAARAAARTSNISS